MEQETKQMGSLSTYLDGFQSGIYWCKKYGLSDNEIDVSTTGENLLDTAYNLAIDHAISIVESNQRTIHMGNKATENPEVLCTQIINSLSNLKKK